MKKFLSVLLLVCLTFLCACSASQSSVVSQPLPENIVGTWYNENDETAYRLEEDSSWVCLQNGTLVMAHGTYTVSDDIITLTDSDGSEYDLLTGAENDGLQGKHLLFAKDSDAIASVSLEEILGNWKYDNYEMFLDFFDNGNFTYTDDTGTVVSEGTFEFHGFLLILTDAQNTEMDLILSESGLLDDSGDGISKLSN